MGVKDRRMDLLSQLFISNRRLETDKIASELGIKKRSIKSYVSELRDKGFEIISHPNAYEYIGSDQLKQTTMGNSDYRALLLLSIIGNADGQLDKKGVIEAYHNYMTETDAINDKTISRALNQCEENNLVYRNTAGKYMLTADTESLYILNSNDVYEFIEYCDIYAAYLPHANEVARLKEKIIFQTGADVIDTTIFDIGRSYHSDRNIVSTMKIFKPYNYREKQLSITFHSQKGELCIPVAVITFLYHMENDRHYILGLSEEQLVFIRIDAITHIIEQDKANTVFGQADYIKKLNFMFGASYDELYHVRVEFSNVFNIREKLEKLKKTRSSATLMQRSSSLIYEDTITGLNDFARYLRTFGSSCQVLEPLELRQMMKESYIRILENYGVKQNEHR